LPTPPSLKNPGDKILGVKTVKLQYCGEPMGIWTNAVQKIIF